MHFRSTYTHNSHCDAVKRFVELMTLPAGVVIPSPSAQESLPAASSLGTLLSWACQRRRGVQKSFFSHIFYSFPARRAFSLSFFFVIYIFHFSLWQKLPSTHCVCVCVGIVLTVVVVVMITVIASRTQGMPRKRGW